MCASRKPGNGTDPSRFTDMGYCDDEKIRCWLDKKSVENAITRANIGLKDETLEFLEDRTLTLLRERGEIFEDGTLRGGARPRHELVRERLSARPHVLTTPPRAAL